MDEIRPRQYAAQIAALTTRQQRVAALDKVPEHFRALVVTHVTNTFSRRHAKS
jgi:hypothetical protein